jgi:hypothetical protein
MSPLSRGRGWKWSGVVRVEFCGVCKQYCCYPPPPCLSLYSVQMTNRSIYAHTTNETPSGQLSCPRYVGTRNCGRASAATQSHKDRTAVGPAIGAAVGAGVGPANAYVHLSRPSGVVRHMSRISVPCTGRGSCHLTSSTQSLCAASSGEELPESFSSWREAAYFSGFSSAVITLSPATVLSPCCT